MKKNMFKVICFLMLILCFVNIKQVYADQNIRFKNITIEEGLSQSTVQIIFQDSRGYVWMGTNDGLNRYNGYEFDVYRHTDDEEKSICDDYILNITEDKSGYLWVSTLYGVSRITLKDGEVKNYFASENHGNLPDNYVNNIFVTSENRVMAATNSGVGIYNRETDAFEDFIVQNETITDNEIKAIVQDINGGLWIGTKEGIVKFNHKDITGTTYLKGYDVNSMLMDRNGFIWASLENNGLAKIDIITGEVNKYNYENKSLPTNVTKKMMQDKDGNVWIGTWAGLVCYVNNEDTFITYNNKPYDVNSLLDDSVYCVFQDRGGVIWVGTYSGVSIFDSTRKIKHYKANPYDENSLSSNVIHGIYEDDDGYVWIGTSNKGLNVYNRKEDKFINIVQGDGPSNICSNNIKVITGGRDIIWVGTNMGLNRIDKSSGTIKVYTTEDGLVNSNIKSLLLDSSGKLWIGTAEGLDILDTEKDEFVHVTEKLIAAGVTDIYIDEIFEDRDGFFWIGGFLGGGLSRINPYDWSITSYCEKGTDSSNLRAINTVRTIVEDKLGGLWIGTTAGLRQFNKKTGEFITYTVEDGLPSNTIYGILIDDQDNFWVSTNNGICMIDITNKEFKNLSIIDGLQSNEFNGKAFCKGSNGRLYFGGVNGLNEFLPSDFKKSDYVPGVIFDKFEVQGKVLYELDNTSIDYGKNVIRIRYFVPNYINLQHIKYQYKLQGLSDEWISLSANEVIFEGLKPGNYTFTIKARNQDGDWSEENHVSFTIKPPIWRSKYALLLYCALLIMTIYLNSTKMKRLDALVKKRTKQLEEEIDINNDLFNKVIELEKRKNNYFINLSHELRTPLNVITSVQQLMVHLNRSKEGINREKVAEYMDVMEKNTKRLLNLINNIIDVSKFDHGSYRINIKDENIVYVVEEAALSLKQYAESKGIELIIDTEMEEKIIPCDALEIERCIVNLVGNAVKYTPDGGKIEVLIFDLNDKVKIEVKDTGIGIDSKYHKAIFDRFNQGMNSNYEEKGGSGLGLTITKHIVGKHSGEIYVESEKDCGSTFTIILPAPSI